MVHVVRARVVRQVLAAGLFVALLLTIAACGGDGGSSQPGRPADTSGSTDEQQLAAAVARAYPGFEMIELIEIDKTIYMVAARHEVVPGFAAKLAFMKDREWERSVSVEGTLWSTNGLLDHAATDSTLLTGPFQAQLLEAVVADAGLVGGEDGRYVTQLTVPSNVEAGAFVQEPSGEYSSYQYTLDMSQEPHRYVLRYKAENR